MTPKRYVAAVRHKGEIIFVVLEPSQVLGGRWRIGYQKKTGNYAGWRCCTELFDTREECQAKLDELAVSRGLNEKYEGE